MNLSEVILSKLPGWMRKTRYIHWAYLAEAIAIVYDVLAELLREGRLASMPGQVDSPDLGGFWSTDALDMIGRDRRIMPGLEEEPWQYAARERGWLTSHRRAGVGPWLLVELQAILRPAPPLVRVVSALGRWWTREADEGAIEFLTQEGDGFTLPPSGTPPPGGGPLAADVPHPWNWGGDEHQIFPIIYAPCTGIDEGDVYGGELVWGEPGATWGTSATLATVEAIRAVVVQYRAAGMLAPWIIIAFDPASFDPLSLLGDAGMPNDNDWEVGTKVVDVGGGQLEVVPTRLETARYWIGKQADDV